MQGRGADHALPLCSAEHVAFRFGEPACVPSSPCLESCMRIAHGGQAPYAYSVCTRGAKVKHDEGSLQSQPHVKTRLSLQVM